MNSPESNPLEFPVDCLYQLENNVFTETWSIPYKKDEWLGRLLTSAIALLKEGLLIILFYYVILIIYLLMFSNKYISVDDLLMPH